MSIKKAAILSDIHIPFHNKRAYELTLSILMDIGIDELVLNGDFADFYGVSAHERDPTIGISFSEEIDALRSELVRLDEMFSESGIVFISGNHENRLMRYAAKNASALFKYASIEKILDIDLLGFRFIDYSADQKHYVLNTDLVARHEPLTGKNSLSCSYIHGHLHRFSLETARSISHGDIYKIGCGFLGDRENKVFNYVKNPPNWQIGFVMVYLNEDTGQWWHENCIIKKNIADVYECFCCGSVYSEK